MTQHKKCQGLAKCSQQTQGASIGPVYLVKGCVGRCDDGYEYPIKGFLSKDKAKEYAEYLNNTVGPLEQALAGACKVYEPDLPFPELDEEGYEAIDKHNAALCEEYKEMITKYDPYWSSPSVEYDDFTHYRVDFKTFEIDIS